MSAIRQFLRSIAADRCGATAIEYGLIAALIVIAMMTGLEQLGGGAGGMWTDVSSNVDDAMPG